MILKLRLPSAKLAVEVAEALLQQYLARRAEIRRAAAGLDFFDSQLKENRLLLDRLEQARAEVREKWNLSSSQDQRSLLLKQLSDIQNDMRHAESEMSRLRRQQAVMEVQVSKGPDLLQKEQVSSHNPSIAAIKDRITSLQVEKAKIASRYLPESDVVKKIEREVADLEAMLAKESPTILSAVTSETNPVRKEFTRDIEEHAVKIAGLQSQAETLKAPATRINTELQRLNSGSDNLEKIEREFRLAEQNYLAYAKKREEARISEELDSRRVANVTVLGSPDLPIEPVSPRKLFIMGIAIPLALIISILFAALLEAMDDRISTERDLAAVGNLNFLGSVPV